MRNFLFVYASFMVAVSTINTVTLTIAFVIGHNIFTKSNALEFHPSIFPNGLAGELCGVFTSWGADAFMVSLRLFE